MLHNSNPTANRTRDRPWLDLRCSWPDAVQSRLHIDLLRLTSVAPCSRAGASFRERSCAPIFQHQLIIHGHRFHRGSYRTKQLRLPIPLSPWGIQSTLLALCGGVEMLALLGPLWHTPRVLPQVALAGLFISCRSPRHSLLLVLQRSSWKL